LGAVLVVRRETIRKSKLERWRVQFFQSRK
jgi:hypothetical protein